MQRSGFTIIEMAIALAVSFIVVGIAVPRYNSLVRQQEFYAQVQKIVGCLQDAQSVAATSSVKLSNGAPARWTAANLQSSGTGYQCTVLGMDSSTSLSNLGFVVPLDQLGRTDAQLGSDLNLPTSMRIYFGALEHGVPVAQATSVSRTQGVIGAGLPLDLTVTSYQDSALSATISIDRTGVPIRIVKGP